MLSGVGIPKDKVIGITPDFRDAWVRGKEIQKWLDDNPTDLFIVIDDDVDDLQQHVNVLINTEIAEGFNEKDAERAIELLNPKE